MAKKHGNGHAGSRVLVVIVVLSVAVDLFRTRVGNGPRAGRSAAGRAVDHLTPVRRHVIA